MNFSGLLGLIRFHILPNQPVAQFALGWDPASVLVRGDWFERFVPAPFHFHGFDGLIADPAL